MKCKLTVTKSWFNISVKVCCHILSKKTNEVDNWAFIRNILGKNTKVLISILYSFFIYQVWCDCHVEMGLFSISLINPFRVLAINIIICISGPSQLASVFSLGPSPGNIDSNDGK